MVHWQAAIVAAATLFAPAVQAAVVDTSSGTVDPHATLTLSKLRRFDHAQLEARKLLVTEMRTLSWPVVYCMRNCPLLNM